MTLCHTYTFELKRALEVLHPDSSDDSSDGEAPEVLMDQTTQDSFSKTVFNEMFLLHMTCPFCIPFYLAAGKAKLLASTSIWPPANAMDVMWTVIPLFIYVNIALFVIYHDRFVATNMGVSEIVYLPLGALMVHRAMIALKYSGLSQVEYQRWADAPVPIAKRWSRQIQLLSTWLPLPDHVLLMEIQKSCRIQGADLHHLFFEHEVKDDFSWRIWNVWKQTARCSRAELTGEMPCERHAYHFEAGPIQYGLHKISALDMLQVLWRIAIDHVREFHRGALVGVWALLPALVPPVWRAVASNVEGTRHPRLLLEAAFGSTPPVVYCCVTSGLLCYLHILLAGLFAVMAIVHYKRMHLVLESVCRLTRPLFCMWPNLPQAQLCGTVGSENIRAVLACFEVSLRLGGRYQSRVEAYVATLALAAILGMGLVLVGVVVGVHNQMNSITVVVLSLVAGFTVIMFRTIYFGSKANENFAQLSNNICRARWRNCASGTADEPCEQVMSLAMERLSILAETEPVNIAGTIPTIDLGYSLMSVVGTLMLFIVGKLFNWDIPA